MATRTSGIDITFRGKWIGYVQPITEEQKEYIEKLKAVLNHKVWSLVVGGTPGNGKSYLAQIAVNTFNDDKFCGGYYISQALLQAELRENGSKAFVKYAKTPFLVIDELSDKPEDWTDYIKTNIENIFVERHRQNLATIVIGNVDLKRLIAMFDLRIRDRLKEGLVMTMKAPSLRKANKEK